MSKSDVWFFGFVTLWIILCSGKPDLLDAITVRTMGSMCSYDVYTNNVRWKEVIKGE